MYRIQVLRQKNFGGCAFAGQVSTPAQPRLPQKCLISIIYFLKFDLMSLEQDLFKLKPIAYLTMADQVESQLREYIIKRAIKPGDPIPKETEIAQALGVSRNVVREALSRLRMLGMIESRKKRGMILTQPDVMKGLELIIHPTILDEHVRKQLFELRLVLEVGLGDLLFRRKTAAQLKQLDDIVEREQRASTKIERIR